jgi:hypothetical protein
MKEVDKILRSKLYNHASELPTDMWSRIEFGMEEEKKRRGGAWMWLASLALILLAGTGYASYQLYKNASITEAAETKVNIEETKTDNPIISNEEKAAIRDLSTIATQSTEDETSRKEKNSSLLPLSEFVSNKSSNSKVGTSLPSNGTSLLHVSTDESPITIEGGSSVGFDDIHGIDDGNDLLISAQNKFSERKNSSFEFYPMDVDLLPLEIEKRLFPDPIGCPSFSRRYRPNIFAEAYYQPMMAFSLISPNSSEIGDAYLDLKRDTESRLYSWSAGINLGWISDYNVGVKAGLNFEEVNERFTYEDPDAIRNQTVITIDTIFNNDGTFNVLTDTSMVQVSGSEIQRIYNYHRTLNVPIHALYQFNFDNLAIELSGGPIFNISYTNRGKVVDPSNEDQWFTNDLSGAYRVFKDRLSVSFSVSIGLMYAVNENIQVFARPALKYHPGSMTTVTSPFNQRYLNTGLSLGARYYFSGNPNY